MAESWDMASGVTEGTADTSEPVLASSYEPEPEVGAEAEEAMTSGSTVS